jgi:BlaI family transcriptional regulator, penicillinase repressor
MQMISLNQNELEVLRILWERGESKPSDIQAHFSWPIENATLRSVLMNLVEKKHLVRRPQGKAFLYSAQVPKATMLQNLVQHLARVFAGGSNRELVAQLVETTDIKPADLALLHEKAAGTKPQIPKRKSI